MPHLPTIGGQSKSEEKKRKLILLTPEFFKKWDSFVETHPSGSIYHLSGWKKVLEESFKHITGEILAICEEDSSEIVAGLPLYLVNSKITGKRYVSSPFANFCDPLTSDPEDAKLLLTILLESTTKRSHPTWRSRQSRTIISMATFHSAPLLIICIIS